MFAVRIAPEKVTEIASNKHRIWVKDNRYSFYVKKAERGLWTSEKDAYDAITEPWEIVVEIKDVKVW